MYVIIVYDVAEKRVNKICQFLRRYLNWIQNSVFEGELTESQLTEIKINLKELIKEKRDSIFFFVISNKNWIKKEILGVEKAPISQII